MESRVLFSSQFNFPVNSPFKTRETSIAPLTPSRNVLSFSFRSPAERCAMRIVPLVKAASSTPQIVAEVDGSSHEPRRKKLAVFVSGGGSNFRKIHEGCSDGSVNGDVVLLVTNKKDCGGAEYARSNGIPVLVFPKAKREPSDGLSPSELVDVLRKYGVDFVLLAGYLKLIPVELVQAFPKRILNIHPALLPAFGGKGLYGIKVHKAVLESGARYSGPTIHFVNEEYDTGRILAQSAVRVIANDTPEELAKRVLHEEHKLYVEVVGAICEERIKWREDGVPLIQNKQNPDEYY
ncbi:This gene is a member of the formyl transferase family PF/00551 and may be a pseudogene of gb/X74767 phosphoribosylglycinamide formyl transferase (PUR3) from Arabidopsis thaliana since our sequence differs from PUR3 by an insertion of an A at bp 225 and a deletion of an A at bp 1276 [Arabidopsis thaliana]|uniref:Phosphoribosylglycinamide formyltransferase, chloroplastic n=1 Tax=Arabidopsis thaliana TaxID=3702 RepID=PUR3_ARATH|nr:Formyl transferase [Arabidopsis thaliana]P52422.2 RecName: Full=Phosphoribosylglycinamide formyltransferase, chloroplastic; AltName: Full=5'-phosphoribosylglycinamide transformylase; AltName: Full=GAR transformylase; Short=GART; Flags: Precursor [Arabidopsis thaliana]AAD21688.1 This gene is a member of the formyl transferase family PF/00551 and may be a pseudogene of gb/X74767 phosphoribosylglycinamide formyl transferase (PUR3) from Arabidopsis thaliana since our sequence differs from PUR3 by |eukprot:NP_174407.1 Formyl transferase [Arabidopsis thaliana]